MKLETIKNLVEGKEIISLLQVFYVVDFSNYNDEVYKCKLQTTREPNEEIRSLLKVSTNGFLEYKTKVEIAGQPVELEIIYCPKWEK